MEATLVPDHGDTVLDALRRAAAATPDAVFLDFGGDLLTYAEVEDRSTRMAHAFAELGVGAGQVVVSLLDNSADAVLVWFAVNKLQAVWVPVNTAYRGEFLRHQVADSCARLAICEDAYLDTMLEVAPQTPDLARILVRSADAVPARTSLPVAPLDQHRGSDTTPLNDLPRPSDLSCLIYTSGTTGPSKGCMFNHNYLCNQGLQFNRRTPPGLDDVNWTCLPLFHTSALSQIVAALLVGGRIAIERRFSVSNFWDEIERSGATRAVIMASIFPWLAYAPDTDAMVRCRGQLKSVTGVPVAPEIRAIWQERFGVPRVDSFGYGQSEGVMLAYATPKDDPPLDSCGPVADEDFEVRIADEDDHLLPDGQVGEIVFRPRRPNIMFAGFWRRPEDTAAVWRNLWMHTGDLGRIENGILFFVDRKKDYLRSRGENISSFEVEQAFLTHPAVAEVAVHAVAAGIAEDAVKATIVLHEKATCSEEELCRWSIDKLPHFAVPRFLEFRTDLARTPNGRVMKYRLRDDGITTNTWDREEAGLSVRRRV